MFPLLITLAGRNLIKICILEFLIIWLLLLMVLYCRLTNSDLLWLSNNRKMSPHEVAYENKISMMRHEIAQLRLLLGSKMRSASNSPSLHDREYCTIYVVTPTYVRTTQKADLTRLSHTLLLVPCVHWIVIEDADSPTDVVQHLLLNSGLQYTHLAFPTPKKYKLKNNQPNWLKPRGVHQRNLALSWLRRAYKEVADPDAVVYFADDDNTYDVKLFDEIRSTLVVSVWPVGLVGGLKWEGPKVENGKVVGWISAWKPQRLFAIDMAAFAVHLKLILNKSSAKFSADVPRGFVETSFLKMLTTPEQMEPKANNCTKVYVWHTRTEKYKAHLENKLKNETLQYVSEINIEV